MSASLVVTPLACQNGDCTLPMGGRCARAAEFADPLVDCPELLRQSQAPDPVLVNPAPQPSELLPADAAPWRGRHLDAEEAEQLLQRSPARLIAVLGPYNAGKTSLLASLFLQIANGQYGPLPYRFSSSRTLHGFRELVNRANQWSGKEDAEIVQHTPKEQAEHAGHFLHLGLRPGAPSDDRHIDVILSDVAGEWVSEWKTRADDESRRRLSFIGRSDGFVLVVDAAALMGPSGATMDADVGILIRRTVGEMRKVPTTRGLSLVFSKFDRILDQVSPPAVADRQNRDAWGPLGKRIPRIWAALGQAREAGLDVCPFAVSAFPRPLAQGQPVGVLPPFAHVLSLADRRERWPSRPVPIREGASFFSSMRRWGAAS